LAQRLDKVLPLIPEGSACLFTTPQNMRYVSGFTGEGGVLVAKDGKYVITDFRYTEQAGQQAPDFEAVETGASKNMIACVDVLLKKMGIKKLLIETNQMSYDQVVSIKEALSDVEIAKNEIDLLSIRAVKDEEEIEILKKAEAITDDAFTYLLEKVRPGMTELNVVALLYKFFLDNGATGFSFNPIVASGENSSLPHAIAGDRVIRDGDFVTFDIGCRYKGYCSDFTRTIGIGTVDPQLKKIYNIVLEANMRAIEAIAPGVSGKAVDAVARDYITDNGFGPNFGHSAGHGVGLQIHESPRLSTLSKDILQPGMVVTVEPGIYLPGKGGVRIEDVVLVTKDGYELLSHSAKDLIIL